MVKECDFLQKVGRCIGWTDKREIMTVGDFSPKNTPYGIKIGYENGDFLDAD